MLKGIAAIVSVLVVILLLSSFLYNMSSGQIDLLGTIPGLFR